MGNLYSSSTASTPPASASEPIVPDAIAGIPTLGTLMPSETGMHGEVGPVETSNVESKKTTAIGQGAVGPVETTNVESKTVVVQVKPFYAMPYLATPFPNASEFLTEMCGFLRTAMKGGYQALVIDFDPVQFKDCEGFTNLLHTRVAHDESTFNVNDCVFEWDTRPNYKTLYVYSDKMKPEYKQLFSVLKSFVVASSNDKKICVDCCLCANNMNKQPLSSAPLVNTSTTALPTTPAETLERLKEYTKLVSPAATAFA
jgi:hypothetical protein